MENTLTLSNYLGSIPPCRCLHFQSQNMQIAKNFLGGKLNEEKVTSRKNGGQALNFTHHTYTDLLSTPSRIQARMNLEYFEVPSLSLLYIRVKGIGRN